MKLRDKSTLIYIFLAALAVRLIYVVFSFGLELVPDPDSVDYLNYAKNLVAGNGYISGPWRCFRAPGYPFFVAAVYSIFGQSVSVLKIIQTAISALIPAVIYLIGLRAGGRKTAVLAGVFSCFYFGLVYEPAHILSEAIFTFLFALSVLLLLNVERHKAYALASGAVLALTALTRPVGLLIAPVAVLWFIIKFPAREALKTCALMLVSFAIVMAPWWARNYRLFGAFVPVCLETGLVVKHLHSPPGKIDFNDNLPELERDRQNFKEGAALIKTQSPLALIKKCSLNLMQFLYPFMPVYDLTYAVIFPFWLYGIYFVIRSKNIQALALFAMFIYFPVAFAFCGTARHRHSMGPYFILLAAIAVEALLNKIKTRKNAVIAWSVSVLWAGLNTAIFIYSEPVRVYCEPLRLLVKRMLLGR